MADTWEVQAPDGSTIEIQSDQPPTQDIALRAMRAYGDQQAAAAQKRAEAKADYGGRIMTGVGNLLSPLLHPLDTISNAVSGLAARGKFENEQTQNYLQARARGDKNALANMALSPSELADRQGTGKPFGLEPEDLGQLVTQTAIGAAAPKVFSATRGPVGSA